MGGLHVCNPTAALKAAAVLSELYLETTISPTNVPILCLGLHRRVITPPWSHGHWSVTQGERCDPSAV